MRIVGDKSNPIQGLRDEAGEGGVSYRDYLFESAANVARGLPRPKKRGPRGGVLNPFPVKLYDMLKLVEEEQNEHIISWEPHGRSFTIHKPDIFEKFIMARSFGQTKLSSFLRQMSLYGFQRLLRLTSDGGLSYYHELFLRGRPDLAKLMLRTGAKPKSSGAVKEKRSPKSERKTVAEDPDFTSMPICSDKSVDVDEGDSSAVDTSGSRVNLVMEPTFEGRMHTVSPWNGIEAVANSSTSLVASRSTEDSEIVRHGDALHLQPDPLFDWHKAAASKVTASPSLVATSIYSDSISLLPAKVAALCDDSEPDHLLPSAAMPILAQPSWQQHPQENLHPEALPREAYDAVHDVNDALFFALEHLDADHGNC